MAWPAFLGLVSGRPPGLAVDKKPYPIALNFRLDRLRTNDGGCEVSGLETEFGFAADRIGQSTREVRDEDGAAPRPFMAKLWAAQWKVLMPRTWARDSC